MSGRPSRVRRRFVRTGAAALVLALGAALSGFVRITFSPGGAPFAWAQLPVSFVIQARGSDDIADASEVAAVRLAARRWEELAASSIALAEDTAANAARTDFDAQDIHLVLWDEDGSSGLFSPGDGVVALTPILASTTSGQIFDADIVFNGGQPFATRPASGRFDVQSVATHEMGHFIGLDHACGPFATMHSTIVAGSTTARSLSRDEEAAAVRVYPGATARGRIAGSVVRQGAGGLAFAQVVAIDLATGEVAVSAVTDGIGAYALEALPAGTYALYAEPCDGPFVLGDTIGLAGQTAADFPTTPFTGAVTVVPGSTTSATWAVAAGAAALNAAGASGGRVVAGGPPATLVLDGLGMGSVTEASVTGAGVSVTQLERIGGSLLRLTLQAGAGAARGVRSVEVRDGAGNLTVCTAAIDVQDPDPAITAVAPAALPSQGGALVTLDGTGFVDGCDVVIGGQLATNVVTFGATQVRCNAPPTPGTTAAVDVVVIRPDGREARAVGAVTYEANPVPTGVDPAFASTAGGTLHTISGAGFASGATVSVGTASATVLSITPTAIQIVAPAQPAGPADVVVTVGERSGRLAGGLTYVVGTAPFAAAFAPTSGPTGGGAVVTITGTGFASDARVRFGQVEATGVAVTGGTSLVCVAPAQAAGAVAVRVTNPATQLASVAPGLFTYADPLPTGGGSSSSSGCALAAGPGPAAPIAPAALLALVFVGLVRARGRGARPGTCPGV